jgi:G3E family GTPase
MAWVGEWSQAGGIRKVDQAGFWWAAVPEEQWLATPAALNTIRSKWHEPHGDRRQELVFIGTDAMDRAGLTAQLDACLLTDEEFARGPRRWSALEDPFPKWE